MSLPLVSILIPCYNAERWLAESIESALAQTWPNREVIVVDDGSTDRSLAVARSFEPRGIRILPQANRGAAAARNTGLGAAHGEYIQFLDADDLLDREKIARQMILLTAAPAMTLSSSRWGRFTDSTAATEFRDEANFRDLSGVEFLQLFYETSAMMQPAAWLAPRPLLDAAGPWDEALSLNDDGEYFARVMLRATRIRFCGDARVYYRSSARPTLSRRRDPAAMQSTFRATESILAQLLAIDQSPRTRAAAAYGWKWTAFELYPEAPALSRRAMAFSRALGGSNRPFPAGPRFQQLARFLGWRLAKRIRQTS